MLDLVQIDSASDLAAAAGVVTHLLSYRTRQPVDPRTIWSSKARDWQSLQSEAGRLPTTSMEWCRSAGEVLHYASDVAILSVGARGRSDALAALSLCRIRSINHLTFLSQNLIHEPMDFLYRDEEALEALLHKVLRLRRPLYLSRLDARSAIIDMLNSGALPWCIRRITNHPGCPVIHLDQRWLTPENCLNSRKRQDLRRGERKAAQFGRRRSEVLAPTPEQLPALLDMAYQVEAANWKGQSRSSLLHDPIRGEFFRRFAELAAERGTLRLAFLYLDDQPAAMQFAIESNGGYWLFKIGYDKTFSICSPGQILMRDTIAYAAANNLRSFDFLGSIAPWTEAWTRDHRECVTLQAYPAGCASAVALAGRIVTGSWRHLKRRRKLEIAASREQGR